MANPNFELEIYKAFKTALYNTISYSSAYVPYFADKVGSVARGIYIGGYQEQEEDTKDRFGARCFVTLTVFSKNDGKTVTNNIADQVREKIKASVTSNITSSLIDIVIVKSPRVVRFEDLDNGDLQHRVEITYELLVFAIS